MVVFVALRLLALDRHPCLALLAHETLVPESFLVDILNALDINHPVFLLEVALRNPDGAGVVYPDVVAIRCFIRICCFVKVIVVTLFLFLPLVTIHLHDLLVFLIHLGSLPRRILFSLLAERASSRILVVSRISVLKNRVVNVDVRALHRSSFHAAQRTGQVYASWAESSAHIADPAFGGHFGESNAALMQTNVAHATKNYQIVISVVPVSANLTLGILKLLLLFLYLVFAHLSQSLPVKFLLSLLQIFQILFLLGVQLKHKLERVFGREGHKVSSSFW